MGTHRHLLVPAYWTAAAAGFAAVAMTGTVGGALGNGPALSPVWSTVSAVVCLVGATAVTALADRRRMAEAGLLGASLTAASVLMLVHALSVPDVVHSSSAAAQAALAWAMPVAFVVVAPLLVPDSRLGRRVATRWRDWSLGWITVAFLLASAILVVPGAIPTASLDSPIGVAATAVPMGGFVHLWLRHLRLFVQRGRPANLIASVSLLGVASIGLQPLSAAVDGSVPWHLHVFGTLAVTGTVTGLALLGWRHRAVAPTLEPILRRDPLSAFDLALSPVVGDFVAELAAGDPSRSDHVVRTTELTMRVGERLGLTPKSLRDLGLAAMLHDIGKSHVPDSILDKPGRLTADEYRVVMAHPVDGEAILGTDPLLAGVAPIVRHHHERPDGQGYPDRLVGSQIPLGARIVAVCDAVDAMTHDRPYRAAMSPDLAFAIMGEYAGTHWDADVVRHLMEVWPTMSDRAPSVPVDGSFRSDRRGPVPDSVGDAVGTTGTARVGTGPQAVPDTVLDTVLDTHALDGLDLVGLLETVDAEI